MTRPSCGATFVGIDSPLTSEVDDNHRFILWNLTPNPANPRKVGTFLGGNVTKYVPGGTLISEAGGACRLMDPATGAPGVELAGLHFGNDGPMGWSSDRRIVAVSVPDRRVVLWDATNGHELEQYTIESGSIDQLLFSPDARRIAARDDKAGRIYLRDRSLRRSLTLQVDPADRARARCSSHSRPTASIWLCMLGEIRVGRFAQHFGMLPRASAIGAAPPLPPSAEWADSHSRPTINF